MVFRAIKSASNDMTHSFQVEEPMGKHFIIIGHLDRVANNHWLWTPNVVGIYVSVLADIVDYTKEFDRLLLEQEKPYDNS